VYQIQLFKTKDADKLALDPIQELINFMQELSLQLPEEGDSEILVYEIREGFYEKHYIVKLNFIYKGIDGYNFKICILEMSTYKAPGDRTRWLVKRFGKVDFFIDNFECLVHYIRNAWNVHRVEERCVSVIMFNKKRQNYRIKNVS
jgi:hypothetical protein